MKTTYVKYLKQAGGTVLCGLAYLALCTGSAAALEEDFNSIPVGSSIDTQDGWSLSSTGQGIIRSWEGSGDFGNYLEVSATGGSTGAHAQWNIDALTGHISISVDVLTYLSGQFAVRRGNDSVAFIQFRAVGSEVRAYENDGNYTVLTTNLKQNEWYRIQMDLYLDNENPESGSWSVSLDNLTRGERAGSAVDLALANNLGQIDSLRFQSIFGVDSVYGWDNISVIPEARTQAALFGVFSLSVVMGFRFLRRR